ncbi:MAG: hypothetical protein MJ234_04640 [bacterium]|nr:hypothetical protein [bacterium]
MAQKAKKCICCGESLKKDWIALNKKFIGRESKEFFCISCLAERLECTIEDLEDKIEILKEEGCALFS